MEQLSLLVGVSRCVSFSCAENASDEYSCYNKIFDSGQQQLNEFQTTQPSVNVNSHRIFELCCSSSDPVAVSSRLLVKLDVVTSRITHHDASYTEHKTQKTCCSNAFPKSIRHNFYIYRKVVMLLSSHKRRSRGGLDLFKDFTLSKKCNQRSDAWLCRDVMRKRG